MRNDQSDLIGSGSMDISKHFDMMESRGLWNCKKCTEELFCKMRKGTHLTKDDFQKHLGIGFTGFGVQMDFL